METESLGEGRPFDDSRSNLLRFYCGAYYGPPLPPEGESAECGWEGVVEVDDIEVPRATCPKCRVDLGTDDVLW